MLQDACDKYPGVQVGEYRMPGKVLTGTSGKQRCLFFPTAGWSLCFTEEVRISQKEIPFLPHLWGSTHFTTALLQWMSCPWSRPASLHPIPDQRPYWTLTLVHIISLLPCGSLLALHAQVTHMFTSAISKKPCISWDLPFHFSFLFRQRLPESVFCTFGFLLAHSYSSLLPILDNIGISLVTWGIDTQHRSKDKNGCQGENIADEGTVSAVPL